MDNQQRSKEILDNRMDYPLPYKDGTKDYLFYFVPAKDSYGIGARNFFDRFYPKHNRKEVSSLQHLINHLHREVTERKVAHIREIVIVSHGNPLLLSFPVLQDVTTDNLPQYMNLSAFSLQRLQSDLLEGKHISFHEKRKKIVEHLNEDSWVTIRACNFGYSQEGMYAFYSFWGGKANVYAPAAYQFFGDQPVDPGMRFENYLEVYEHLVKQRFLPNNRHSQHRKDVIVNHFITPPSSRSSFVLAQMKIHDPITDEMRQYGNLINDLNRCRITPFIKQAFKAAGLELSIQAKIGVFIKDTHWIIEDTVKVNETKFKLKYQINEIFDRFDQEAKLEVSASLKDAISAKAYIPIQAFFLESENDLWTGHLFELAFYSEASTRGDKDLYEKLLNTLKSEKFGSETNIFNVFKESGYDITTEAKITTHSSEEDKLSWLISDNQKYFLVKAERKASSDGDVFRILSVYEYQIDESSRSKRKSELMSFLGTQPDSPGVELMAYFDRFEIEELLALIKYLRSHYKPDHVVYIFHAGEAIRRKKNYISWLTSTPEWEEMEREPLGGIPELELDMNKVWDRHTYYFPANTYWKEVKASDPPVKPFISDLFLEQPLKGFIDPGDFEIDSPSNNMEEIRAIEREGNESFFEVEKELFDPIPTDEDELTCEEFRYLLEELKKEGFDSVEELEEKLSSINISPDESLFKEARQASKVYRLMKRYWGFFKTGEMKVGLKWRLLGRVIGVTAATTMGMLETMILPAWMMYKKLLNAWYENEIGWEHRGKILGIREGSYMLRSRAYNLTLSSPVTDLVSTARSFYEAEASVSDPRFIGDPNAMKKGYSEGLVIMEKMATELLDKSEEILDEILREEGLDSCKINVLKGSGLINMDNVRAEIMKAFTEKIQEEVFIGMKEPAE